MTEINKKARKTLQEQYDLMENSCERAKEDVQPIRFILDEFANIGIGITGQESIYQQSARPTSESVEKPKTDEENK